MASQPFSFLEWQEGDLTEDEIAALKSWEIGTASVPDNQEVERGPPRKKSTVELLSEMRAVRVRAAQKKSLYHPALKCVLGSAAEVERLWSMTGKLLTKDRSTMSPLVFECIMYLKYNRDLWGPADVVEANKRRKNKSKAAVARQQAHKERVREDMSAVAEWEAFYDALDSIDALEKLVE